MPKRISQVQNEKILLLNNLYGNIYDYSQTIYNGYDKSFNLKSLIDKYLNKIELVNNEELYVDERTFQIKSIKDSSCLSIFVPQIKICEVA